MATEPTDAELKKLCEEMLALAEKATPGPWKADIALGCKAIKGGKSGEHRQAQYSAVAHTDGLANEDKDQANAAFIAAARTALPTLARELLSRLEAEKKPNG